MQDLPDYRLTMENHQAYLYASVAAEVITTHNTVEYSNRIARRLRELCYGKLLFVRRCPLLSIRDHLLMAHMMRNALSGKLTIASVDDYGNSSYAIREADRASVEAGFDLLGFASVAAADGWLRSLAF